MAYQLIAFFGSKNSKRKIWLNNLKFYLVKQRSLTGTHTIFPLETDNHALLFLDSFYLTTLTVSFARLTHKSRLKCQKSKNLAQGDVSRLYLSCPLKVRSTCARNLKIWDARKFWVQVFLREFCFRGFSILFFWQKKTKKWRKLK